MVVKMDAIEKWNRSPAKRRRIREWLELCIFLHEAGPATKEERQRGKDLQLLLDVLNAEEVEDG